MKPDIENLVKEKEQELLDKYFGNLMKSPEEQTIGDYTPNLTHKIESEYREYLAELWKDFSDLPLVLEE